MCVYVCGRMGSGDSECNVSWNCKPVVGINITMTVAYCSKCVWWWVGSGVCWGGGRMGMEIV